MKVIDWLLQGDPVICRLTRNNLLDQSIPFVEEGYIKKYLDLFDYENCRWGEGIYSPKWTSTHYTLLELKYMEIDPNHEIYQMATKNLLYTMWKNQELDICITAMIVSLCTYGGLNEMKLEEMINYLLLHQFPDGGWNCRWNSVKKPTKSSLNTTISVLEAFRDYIDYGYTHRIEDIKRAIIPAHEFLLKKKLFRSVRTKAIIKPSFTQFHYPTRWKYDAFRALEYFQSIHHPYDDRMDEAFAFIHDQMKKGFISKGTSYSGLVHFKLETTRAGRFNTLRTLKILKSYQPNKYHEYINRDVKALT